MTPREYDLLLLGATGYTGKLTAKFIAKNFPDDLKWAIAGRSETKLHEIAAELRVTNPGRIQPSIEIVNLEHAEHVYTAVRKSRVCISVVSYSKVGSTVVEACVKHGTDYVDTAGGAEVIYPWIHKYHDIAKASGTVLIHSCGMYSGPHDILSWIAARELRQVSGANTKEVILASKGIEETPSGGTFDAIKSSVSKKKDPIHIEAASNPWFISPVNGTTKNTQTNWLGVRDNDDLGMLSEHSPSAAQNQAVVHRTWGLLRDANASYGSRFQFNEYQAISSTLGGFFQLLSHWALSVILGNSLTLKLLGVLMPAPGSGPDPLETSKIAVNFEAVAIAENGPSPRAYAKFSYPSGGYHTTALFLGQAAASLLYKRSLEGELNGGCLTPAVLGQDLVDRLRSAGATVEVSIRE